MSSTSKLRLGQSIKTELASESWSSLLESVGLTPLSTHLANDDSLTLTLLFICVLIKQSFGTRGYNILFRYSIVNVFFFPSALSSIARESEISVAGSTGFSVIDCDLFRLDIDTAACALEASGGKHHDHCQW